MKSRLKNIFLLCLIFLIHGPARAGDSLKYSIHNLPLSSIVSINAIGDDVVVSDNAGQLIKWSSTLKHIVATQTFSGVELYSAVTNSESNYIVILASNLHSENWLIFLLDNNLIKLDSQVINSNIIAISHTGSNVRSINEAGTYFEWAVVENRLVMISEISEKRLAGAQNIILNGADSFIISNTKGQIQQWKKGRNDTLVLLKSINEIENDNFIYDLEIKDGLMLLNRRLGYELRNTDFEMLYDDFTEGAYTTFFGNNEIISISNDGEFESVSYEYSGNFIVTNKRTSMLNFSGKEDSRDSIMRNAQVLAVNTYDTDFLKDSIITQRSDVTGYNFNKTGIVLGTGAGKIEVQSWLGNKGMGSMEMVLEKNRVVKYITPLQPALEDHAILLLTEDSVLYGFLWPKGYLQLTQWPNRLQIPLVYDLEANVYAFIQDSIVWFEDARSTLYSDGESNISFIRFETSIVKYKVNFEGKRILIVLADGTVKIVDYAERTESCSFMKLSAISELETLFDGFMIRFENGDLGIIDLSCKFEIIAKNVRDVSKVHKSKNIFVAYNSGHFNYIGIRKKLLNRNKTVITQTNKKVFRPHEGLWHDIDIFYVIATGSNIVYYTSTTISAMTKDATSDQIIIGSLLRKNGSSFFYTRYGELIEIAIP